MSEESDPTAGPGRPPSRSGDETTVQGERASAEVEATVMQGRQGRQARRAPRADSDATTITPSTAAGTDGMLREIRRPLQERLVHEEEVAEGGMGRVDVAVDGALDRRVAKKTLHDEFLSEPRALGLFLREARITGQLDHPNIVPVYDIGSQTVAGIEQLYFTMKLVHGQTMRSLIRELRPGAIDPPVLFGLLDAATRVCDALSFAHSRGVLHCDVKADNVMVGDFGQVYLMDWGVARPLNGEEGEDGAGAVIGTASYMAPEQARGLRSQLDARSDVFLMGALLYEIVTRRPPYRTGFQDKALALAAEAHYQKPSEVVGEGVVAPELERIILKAMAPAPADRYPDTETLKQDIVRFMRGGAEFEQTTFAAGTTIVREGERGNTAYIIVSGRCQVLKRLDQSMTVLQTLGPGDVFGEMAVLNETTRSATVVALQDVTALVVSGEQLLQEMRTLKPWMASIMQRLAARLQDIYATRKVQTFASGMPADRLARQLYMHLLAWGERTEDGGLRACWSEVARALEEQLATRATAIAVVLDRYEGQIDVDTEADVIEIRRPDELAARLRTVR